MVHYGDAGPPTKERRREERVAQILAAALQVVEEHGVEGVTIARMAKILMWSVGALYRYFPGKEAVLAELQIQVLGDLGEAIVERIDAALQAPEVSMLPPGDRSLLALLVAADCYRRHAEDEPARFALLSGVLAAPREVLKGQEAEAVGMAMSGLLDRVTRLVESATDAGSLQPGSAPERTLLLWSSVQGLLQMRKIALLDPRLPDLPTLVLQLTEGLLLGWGAEAASLVFVRPFATMP
ncbi:MAG: TetR/AcrR family transcriptional regulator [Deltaproteobacteria bacterium]|nr:TetR/AcrR family transcriptional regulator [Deltaproteobacteria bacterium]